LISLPNKENFIHWRVDFMKEIIISIPKFLELSRNNELEKCICDMKKDYKLEKIIVMSLGISMYVNKVANAVPNSTKIDILGNKFLFISRRVGYWVVLIMCIVEIIKTIGNSDNKNIVKIIAKYLIIYASLFATPLLLDMVAEAFN